MLSSILPGGFAWSNIMKNEGFLFLEAAILGIVLVAMTTLFALPRHATELRRMDSCRMTAIFLAEEELAEMEARATQGDLSAGTYGWLGPAEDLDHRQTSYEVVGTAQPESERGYRLRVRLQWQEGGAEKHLELERWIARHDTQ